MQNHENKSRRDFLKKLPLALGSVVILSGFKSEKTKQISEQKFNTLSESEANKILKNEKFPVLMYLDPAPAPVR